MFADRSITDQLGVYMEDVETVYSDVTQLARIVEYAGHRSGNKRSFIA